MRTFRIAVLAVVIAASLGLALAETASAQDTGGLVPTVPPTPASPSATPGPNYPLTPTVDPTPPSPSATPDPNYPLTPTEEPAPAPGAPVPLPNVRDTPPSGPQVDNRHPRGALRPMDINYSVAQVMISGPFKHGSAMTIKVWARWSKKHQTVINSDCAGTWAEVGYLPKYELRNFGRFQTGTTPCILHIGPNSCITQNGPILCGSSRYDWQKLHNRREFQAQRRLKRQALNRARRLFSRVRGRAEKLDGQQRRVPHVPRHRLRAVDGNKDRTVLIYGVPLMPQPKV
jgi:hypothetical protein